MFAFFKSKPATPKVQSPATTVPQSPTVAQTPTVTQSPTVTKSPAGTPSTVTTGTPSPNKVNMTAARSKTVKKARRRKSTQCSMTDDSDSERRKPSKLKLKMDHTSWSPAGQRDAETFMRRYAEMGPDGIAAEFKKEIEDYKNPKFTHIAFTEHPTKNRNINQVTCVDESRVLLRDNYNYINASITKRVEKMDKCARSYILTQMPFEGTLEDFWEMHHDKLTRYIIVFVPDPAKEAEEQGACEPEEPFWPRKQGEVKVCGKMTVRFKKVMTTAEQFTWTQIGVHKEEKLKERNSFIRYIRIAQFMQTEATLTMATARTMLKIGRSIDRFDDTIGRSLTNVVTVVDENSGIARACLFVVIDAMSEAIYQGRDKDPVTLPEVVQWARRCRNHAVRTADDYLFIVRAVAEFIYMTCHEGKYAAEYKKITGVEPPKQEPAPAPAPKPLP